MKKLLAVLLVICLAFAGFVTYKNFDPDKVSLFGSGKTEDPAAEAEKTETTDYAALYATHAPDEVVMKVGDRDVTWGEFFYMYQYGAASMEQTFLYYGMTTDWNMVVDEESGLTLGDAVSNDALQQIRDFAAIEKLGEQNGVTRESVLPEAEETLAGFADSYATSTGETEEAFYTMLQEQYMDKDTYKNFIVWNLTENELFTKLYGANCELISDEDAQKYITDNEYAKLNHILFLCMDMTTGEELDEAAQADKLKQAEALAEELRAAETTEELLALYAQRKEELDEDTGKTAYPDGYICTPDAAFVPEFLDGGYALDEYQVSDPVKSVYGYHVMLRLPVTPDDILDESTGSTARTIVAQQKYNAALGEISDGFEIEYVNGFELPNISDFVR